MSALQLSPQQQQVVAAVMDWFKNPSKPFITVGGYAGTGKTTLVAHIRSLLAKENPKLKVAFCSYTGKATRVLQENLSTQGINYRQDNVSTIHSLIYQAVKDSEDHIIGWSRRSKDKFEFQLIVVDEASMINREIWDDLLSYGVPILAVGDHGQLPPIGGEFSLMIKPDLRLEQIFRQEQGSPIIRLSVIAREEGTIPFGIFGKGVKKLRRADSDTQELLGDLFLRMRDDMLVLTGYNHTRVKLNTAIRGLLEFDTALPSRGDKVICLRNNHQHKIYNGMVGYIRSIKLNPDLADSFYEAEIAFDEQENVFTGQLSVEQFGAQSTLKDERRKGIDLFDFGYALTVHKAQGSQAETVVVFEERFAKMDDDSWRRWLYTAVTRARRELYIVG